MGFYKKGAEAEIKETTFDNRKAVIKKRIIKNYRNIILDKNIRKKRTRSESKILKLLYGNIKVPQVFNTDEEKSEITMELIEGVMLKQVIENDLKLAILAGKEIKKIHSLGIIHGDLTTSNMLINYEKKDKQIYFIDFGLGYFSKKIEDIATDLIVFKKTFNATHPSMKNGWAKVMHGYKPSKELIEKMENVEKRARYH